MGQTHSNGIHSVSKCYEAANGTTICRDEVIMKTAYCTPQNSEELYTCLHQNDTLYMSLISGQEYSIDATSAMEVTGSSYPFFSMG